MCPITHHGASLPFLAFDHRLILFIKWLSLAWWFMQLIALPLKTVRLAVWGRPPRRPILRRAPQAAWDPRSAGRGPPRCGQMGQGPSRQPKRAPLTVQKMMMTKRTLRHPRIGGFQDQAHLGLFVLPRGVLWASGAAGSRSGMPQVAAVVSHGFPLILESSQFL
jgi:hypothetical protein